MRRFPKLDFFFDCDFDANLIISDLKGRIMLREFEKEGLFAIFVRALEAQKARDDAKRTMEEAGRAYKESDLRLASAKSALEVFGFNSRDKDAWKQVRAALGKERVEEGRRLAGCSPKADVPPIPEVELAGQPAPFDSLLGEEVNHDRDRIENEGNIKTLVLSCLKKAGDEGVKASEIKEKLRSDEIEMHDKTVGMTLYRLSKDGLSRREGRLWFATDSDREKEIRSENGVNQIPTGSIFE